MSKRLVLRSLTRAATTATLVLIAAGCPVQDRQLAVTVNQIPEPMNGARPVWYDPGGAGVPKDGAGEGYYRLFRLTVPPSGFTVDIKAPGLRSDAGEQVMVTSARPLGDGAVSVGDDLASYFSWPEPGRATWRVPENLSFPTGPNLLQASLGGADGTLLARTAYRFDVYPLDPYVDPFPVRKQWLLLFDRDGWTTSWHREGVRVVIESEKAPNGIPDFDEALAIAGLHGEETGAGSDNVRRGDVVGANAIVRAMIAERVRGLVRAFFCIGADGTRTEDSVDIEFWLATDPGAPSPGSFAEDGLLSLIAVGGDGDLYGQAEVDWNNQQANDLTDLDEGLFVTNLLRLVIHTPVAWAALGPFLPEVGTPVGECDLDAVVLAEEFDPVRCIRPRLKHRYNALQRAVDLTAQAIAAGVAHETGHSLGLVPNGFPPQGLFGGEPGVEFAGPRTTPSHLDTPGNNLMAAGIHGAGSWRMIDLSMPFFNQLNLAYLQRRLVYCPQLPPAPFDEHPMLNLDPEEQTGRLDPGMEMVAYPLTVSHPLDGEVTVLLDLDYTMPISEPLHVELDKNQVTLGPQGTEDIALTVSRDGTVHLTALDVRVGAHAQDRPWTDWVSVVTFIPPE